MNLSVEIQKKYVNFSIDLSFHTENESMGILGASGCGKSQMLQCIAGIVKPDSGRIVLNGRTLFDSVKKINLPPQKRKVGYLFQNYALFPHMTAAENIGASLERKKKSSHVKEMISLFHLDGLEKHYPKQLSGGQQQRAALARIFASEPEILLLDEPFSALDAYLKDVLQQELLQVLKDHKKDFLIVSHNRDEVYQFGRFLAVMDSGKIVRKGKTEEVFANPDCAAAARLTGCKNIAEIIKKDDYTVEVPDWGMILKTGKRVSHEIRYIGIRAHDLVWTKTQEDENSIFCGIRSITHTPFESDIMLYRKDTNKDMLWWKIKKAPITEGFHENMDIWMRIQKEAILLLK